MATHNITISSVNPVQLLTAANQSISTLANLDVANSVWLSSDPGGGAGAIELTAGSTLSWDSMRALYAYVAVGTTVKVLVLDNGGVFNNGVAVANALNSSGLASAIATQINLAGVPSIDKPATLVNNVSIANLYDSGLLNVAGYESLIITTIQSVAADNNPRSIDVTFYNASGVNMGGAVFLTGSPDNGQTTFRTPVLGTQVRIAVEPTGIPQFSATLTAMVSYRSVKESWYSNGIPITTGGYPVINFGAPFTDAGMGNGQIIMLPDYFSYYTVTPGNFTVNYPVNRSRSGKAHIAVRHDGTAGSITVGVLDRRGPNQTWVFPQTTLTNAQQINAEFIIGYRPWSFFLNCTGVVGEIRITITTTETS